MDMYVRLDDLDIDKSKITPDNKCTFCTGSICCTYTTQEIDTPRSKDEFETLLWQVSHKDVSAYKDEDGWTLMFEHAPCMHLQVNGDCGIYDERPSVCREHTNDFCEFDQASEVGFDLYFPDYDSLLKYCKKRFKRWGIKKGA